MTPRSTLQVEGFFDPATWTVSYIVLDTATRECALIDSVLASPTLEEEQIANLKVDTDGEIATASFDYAYLSDGKLSNWGKEQWLLVRTEQGWKIFSVVYTIRDPQP